MWECFNSTINAGNRWGCCPVVGVRGVGKSPRLTGAVKAAFDEGNFTGALNLRLKVPLHETFHGDDSVGARISGLPCEVVGY